MASAERRRDWTDVRYAVGQLIGLRGDGYQPLRAAVIRAESAGLAPQAAAQVVVSSLSRPKQSEAYWLRAIEIQQVRLFGKPRKERAGA